MHLNSLNIKNSESYLSTCDLINKYSFKNVHEIPELKKIVLELNLEDFLISCDFSQKEQTDSNTQIRAYIIIYILMGLMPFINFNKSGGSSLKAKSVENNYSLKIILSNKKEINSFLTSLFIENWSKLLLEDFLLFKNTKNLSSKKVKSPSKSIVLNTIIPGSIFFEVESLLTKNLTGINSKTLKFRLNFLISNMSNTKNSNNLIKNLPFFWISG